MFELMNETAQNKTRAAANKATAYFKTHWIDSLLFFFLLFVLGAFDIFVLKQSKNFLSIGYWYHSGCRLIAYLLAGVLGVRVFYPKAKAACGELWSAITKNYRYLPLKELNAVQFTDFIDTINNETKIAAWKVKITEKLTKLNKRSPDVFPLYYKTQKTELFDKFRNKNRLIARAEKYCQRRKTLENLMTDEYINENIQILNVKYPKIYETDFTQTTGKIGTYKTYYTRASVRKNAAIMIGNGLLVSLIIAVLAGSFELTLDSALAAERIASIFSIIINAIFDIGFTIGKFVSAAVDCPRIVRQEDLRAVLDQNEILLRFKKELSSESIAEYEKVLADLKETENA